MKSVLLVLTLLSGCLVNIAQASVTASVDKSRLATGETVQLLLQHDGSTNSQPDISSLSSDFEVLGSSSGSSMQIINGHTSSQVQISIILAPKHAGKITIPPLLWDGQKSAALELMVGGNGQGAATVNEASHIFLKTTLNQKQPYVQGLAVLTVRLYADEPIYQASLNMVASRDVLVRQLGQDTQERESLNGHNYQVIERKYLLLPQRSGKLSLNGPVLDAQVQDSTVSDPLFGNIFQSMQGMPTATRTLHLSGKPVDLNVLPRRASATGANWLPAQAVTLEENWPAGIIHAGEPLTRHLHLAAVGLTGEQLPDPGSLLSMPADMKAYPDTAKIDDSPQGDTVRGTRDQDIALIASRPGHFLLPAVRLEWWDANTRHVAVLPAHALDVLPTAGSVTLPAPARPLQKVAVAPDLHEQVGKVSNPGYWPWISLVFFVLWVATMLAWWYTRKSKKQLQPIRNVTITANGAFKAFKLACDANDPHAARLNLLAWADTVWPEQPPLGLNELSRRLADVNLTPPLRQLDRACSTGGTWQGAALAVALTKPPAPVAGVLNKPALPALYS